MPERKNKYIEHFPTLVFRQIFEITRFSIEKSNILSKIKSVKQRIYVSNNISWQELKGHMTLETIMVIWYART